MKTGALTAFLLCFALTPSVAAQPREPLTANGFNIDMVTGPVLGSGRIVGLGGAYTALATGIDAAPWNPAAYATRALWDVEWFAWDGTAGLIPGTLRNTDFDNNGESGFTYEDFLFLTLGLGMQFGELGFGGVFTSQSYRIGATTDLSLLLGNYGVGYTAMQGQLVLGVGLRTASLSVTDGNTVLVDFGGAGLEAGAVLCPAGRPWRLGLAARLPVESEQASEPTAGALNLPRTIRLPWELQGGIAWQLGERPLNRRWENPKDIEARMRRELAGRRAERARRQAQQEALAERMRTATDTAPPRLAHVGEGPHGEEPAQRWLGSVPRERAFWDAEKRRRREEDAALERELEELERRRAREVELLAREHVLLSADVFLTGPTKNGVGFESFLSQERQRSGENVSVGLRLGAEHELVREWLRVRGGSYFEPSRFEGVGYRVHGTLGGDVRLFTWDLFGATDDFTLRFGSSLDVAARYFNVGFGVGMWH